MHTTSGIPSRRSGCFGTRDWQGITNERYLGDTVHPQARDELGRVSERMAVPISMRTMSSVDLGGGC